MVAANKIQQQSGRRSEASCWLAVLVLLSGVGVTRAFLVRRHCWVGGQCQPSPSPSPALVLPGLPPRWSRLDLQQPNNNRAPAWQRSINLVLARTTRRIVTLHPIGLSTRLRTCIQGDVEDVNNEEAKGLIVGTPDWAIENIDEEIKLGDDADVFPGNALTFNLTDQAQLLSSNVSYFYLKNELGLSEAALWRITYEAGAALGMTTATIRRKVEVLRDNMNLSDDDVRTILERHPAILHLSADKNLAPTILFLVRALDLGKDDLRAIVVSSPSVLSYRKDNLKSKINFFTRLMGFPETACRRLLVSEPRLLRVSVPRLVATMRFFVRDIEIPLEKLRHIVQANPRILLYSLDNNLIPKIIYYFIMTLQMNLAQVQKILLSYPTLLDYNLERHILPISTYFLTDLEFSPKEFSAILLKFPRLWTHSLRKIKHHVGYLRFEVGLNASQVKRVLYQAPQILGFGELTLEDKVQFLQDSLDASDAQLRIVLAGMPTLLLLSSTTNLQPKLDLLTRSMGGNRDLVRDAVLRLPTLLGYSLDKRLQPRLERILQAGLDPSSITVGIPMPEERFLSWLGRREHKLRSQRSAIVPLFQPTARDAVPSNKAVGDSPSNRIVHWTRERRPLGSF